MKTERYLKVLCAGILLVLLQACAIYPRSGAPAIVGTWTNSLGTVWTLNSNGTFDVDLNHDGKRDAWGTYTVTDKIISIQATGGLMPKGCKGTGVYRFNRGMDSLQFTLVHDNCKLRVRNVRRNWHLK